MNIHIIDVPHAKGQYPIYIGWQLLQKPELFQPHISGKQVMLVTNETIAPLYLDPLIRSLNKFAVDSLILEDGESFKTLNEWQKILTTLAKNKHHRDTTLIALGGGVIGDLTGFAAACYHRGVNFLQVPTTLLSQVDASIGGKTAVNLPEGKNLVGAFHQPQAVIIDIDTIATLNEREFRAGLAEIIKAALILDRKFFNYLEENIDAILAHEVSILTEIIRKACSIKRDIVAADEQERGERALLNLGHTFGHAAEKCLGYGKWLHGEAVGWGLLQAAKLSCELKLLDPSSLERIYALCAKIHLPAKLPSNISSSDLFETMQGDKKIINNKLRLILLKDIGRAFISQDVEENTLRNFLLKHSSN